MKLLLIALFAVAVAAEHYVNEDFLQKQDAILKLLWKVHLPNPDQEQYNIGKLYNPVQYASDYLEWTEDEVREVVDAVQQHKYLSKTAIFNIFEKKHLDEVRDLFDLLYYSKNWETLYKTAAWAREHYNPGTYVYALTTAIIHMPYDKVDLRGIELPQYYEIFPNMYVPGKAVRKGYESQFTHASHVVTIEKEHTRHQYSKNPNMLLDYFTGDMTLNTQHSMWHKSFPFWWNPEHLNHDNNRQGELFLYVQHQLLNRYQMERSSNHLPRVTAINFEKDIIEEGYAPKTVYENGEFMPTRPDNIKMQNFQDSHYVESKDWASRVRTAIDSGYVMNSENEKVTLNTTRGLDILGRILQGANFRYKPEYYGNLYNNAHKYLGRVFDPYYKYHSVPSVLEHFETVTRDPIYYKLQKNLNVLYKQYKDLLEPYTPEQLSFPGVEVQGVKLVGTSRASSPNMVITHFEDYEFDMSNVQNNKDTIVKGRDSRLQHEPFQYTITVRSKVEKPAFVRIFLAPKYDYLGNKYDINEKRWYAVEMDKFVVQLKQGQNMFKRMSSESSITKTETETYPQMMTKVQEALENKQDYSVNKVQNHCGWPSHLLLPKGTPEGHKYTLYVMVTDYEEDRVPNTEIPKEHTAHSLCGLHHDTMYPDSKPMGYPFDRRITNTNRFFQKNINYVDVIVKNIL